MISCFDFFLVMLNILLQIVEFFCYVATLLR
jgi:hypothetical protein